MKVEEILQQPDGSMSNIRVNLDELELNEKYSVIPQLLSKCAIDGTISIIGLEIFQFGKDIVKSSKTLEEINVILNGVKSMDTLDNIKRFLLQFNFQTVSVKRENGYYVCTSRHAMQ